MSPASEIVLLSRFQVVANFGRPVEWFASADLLDLKAQAENPENFRKFKQRAAAEYVKCLFPGVNSPCDSPCTVGHSEKFKHLQVEQTSQKLA